METKFNSKKVLIAPLDWGLGHATRCIPLIKAFLAIGYEVVIATDDSQEILLKQEFPQLQFLKLNGYGISYSKAKWLLPFKILQQVPKIIAAVNYEHNWLDKVIEEHKISLVVSDNRYGLYTKKIPCVFITHQLIIKAPFGWLENIMQIINYKYINRYNACWVPDAAGDDNIAGKLSHPKKLPNISVSYLGLLSRFSTTEKLEKKYDVCISLSGPEPQRTILEQAILKDAGLLQQQILLLRGKPGSNEKLNAPKNVEVKNHIAGNELQQAFLQSSYIISRSGYTTMMELAALKCKSILIPTPGQTEQEYLAEIAMSKGFCYAVQQSNFNLIKEIETAKAFNFKTIDLPLFDEKRLQHLLKEL